MDYETSMKNEIKLNKKYLLVIQETRDYYNASIIKCLISLYYQKYSLLVKTDVSV